MKKSIYSIGFILLVLLTLLLAGCFHKKEPAHIKLLQEEQKRVQQLNEKEANKTPRKNYNGPNTNTVTPIPAAGNSL